MYACVSFLLRGGVRSSTPSVLVYTTLWPTKTLFRLLPRNRQVAVRICYNHLLLGLSRLLHLLAVLKCFDLWYQKKRMEFVLFVFIFVFMFIFYYCLLICFIYRIPFFFVSLCWNLSGKHCVKQWFEIFGYYILHCHHHYHLHIIIIILDNYSTWFPQGKMLVLYNYIQSLVCKREVINAQDNLGFTYSVTELK